MTPLCNISIIDPFLEVLETYYIIAKKFSPVSKNFQLCGKLKVFYSHSGTVKLEISA
jgi:hypothetical protein